MEFIWKVLTTTHLKILYIVDNSNGTYIEFSYYNRIYNNLFNNSLNAYITGISPIYNYWNTTNQTGPNIVGGPYIGGNYFGKPDCTGFSGTCRDLDGNGFCDSVYNLATDNTDYKNSLLAYFLLFFLYGLFYSMKDGIEGAYISENVGRSGKAYGTYYFGIGMISLVSNIFFGFLFEKFGLYSFIFPSTFSFYSAILLVTLIR